MSQRYGSANPDPPQKMSQIPNTVDSTPVLFIKKTSLYNVRTLKKTYYRTHISLFCPKIIHSAMYFCEKKSNTKTVEL
jgi:hypothetical protein